MTTAGPRSVWIAVIGCGLAATLLARHADGRQASAAIAGSGAISGLVVIDGPSARPARQTAVTLIGGAFPSGQLTLTDEAGRFSFPELVAGHYTLFAAKPSFASAYFGSPRPGRGPGTPIAIGDGERVGDLRLTLLPGAVITGTTSDDRGRARANTTVLVLDAATMRADGAARVAATVRADSAGRYRAAGLAPGTYLVAARAFLTFSGARVPTPQELADLLADPIGTHPLAAAAGPTMNFAPTLFPSVVDPAQAVPLTVGAGQVRDGIDIALQFQPSARVVGRVVDPNGGVPVHLQLSMISPAMRLGFEERAQAGNMRSNGVVPTAADGSFGQAALPPGHYQYFARADGAPASGAGPTLWGLVDLDVTGQDVADLVVHLQPGLSVSGRLAAEAGRTPPTDWSTMRVSLDSTDEGFHLTVPAASVGADGTFVVPGLTPGRYGLSLSGVGPWTALSAGTGGPDLADEGLTVSAGADVVDVVVTMTDRAPSVQGRLVDGLGRPAPEYGIVVFPATRSAWRAMRRIRSVRPSTDGRYVITGLPAGDYLVAAVTDVSAADLRDAAFLDLLVPAATPISLKLGEPRTLDLRLAGRAR